MVASELFNDRFAKMIRGHWLDSIGNSIIVSKATDDEPLTAVLTPLIEHPEARDRVFTIRCCSRTWRCGNANLEWADEQQQRLVWITEDGRRSVWSRASACDEVESESSVAFPWLLNDTVPQTWLPLSDMPRDILYDGARIAALLDIRQMIGPGDAQEKLTHILMDHDLHPMKGDYLVPGAESPLWQTLPVSPVVRESISKRIRRIPHEALSQRISWASETEIFVGHHKISCRLRDIEILDSRWVLPMKDKFRRLEIARLLALYSVFDNPLSNRRNGVHLALDPELRSQCDYELFASPLNAVCPNGHFASKWPHVEWRFGSIGSYPNVLNVLPANSVICVNPPFTEAYLADVMGRLAELKLRFRLRVAVPIQEVPWRKKLLSSLPSAQLLKSYYDASSELKVELQHPTLLWEDPRCICLQHGEDGSVVSCSDLGEVGVGESTTPLSMTSSTPAASPALMPMPPTVMVVTAMLPLPAVQTDRMPVARATHTNEPLPLAEYCMGVWVEAPQDNRQQKAAHAFAATIAKPRVAANTAKTRNKRIAPPKAAEAVIEQKTDDSLQHAAGADEAGQRLEVIASRTEVVDQDTPALDADEWPALSCNKLIARKSTKARR